MAYVLEAEKMDLGEGTSAVGLELLEAETREPVTGETAAQIWFAVFPVPIAGESAAIDFFSHLDCVSDFCDGRGISYRQPAAVNALLAATACENAPAR